jgi:glutamyl-tRNA synthetase
MPKKADLAQTVTLLRLGRDFIGELAGRDDAGAEALVKARSESAGVKLGDLLMPLRVAVTGKRVSPPLFGSIRILGAKTCLARVERALKVLEDPAVQEDGENR